MRLAFRETVLPLHSGATGGFNLLIMFGLGEWLVSIFIVFSHGKR